MFLNARQAGRLAALAPDHDRGSAANGEPETLTVGQSGRATDVVVSALAAMPVDLDRLIAGKSSDDLMRPAQDGGWGLVEILPHLRDWEIIYRDRVESMLTSVQPTLEEYDDSLWAIEHGYRDQDPQEAFAEFTALRQDLVERLQDHDEETWNRVAILPKRGRVTLHWLLDSLCDHDAKHLVQARDVLA